MKTINEINVMVRPIFVIIDTLIKQVKELRNWSLLNLWYYPLKKENLNPLYIKYYNIFREIFAMLWSANKQYIVRIVDNEKGVWYYYNVFHDFDLNKHKCVFIKSINKPKCNNDVRFLIDVHLSSSLGHYLLHTDEEDRKDYFLYKMLNYNHKEYIEALFNMLHDNYEDVICDVDNFNLYDDDSEEVYSYNPLYKSGEAFIIENEEGFIKRIKKDIEQSKSIN